MIIYVHGFLGTATDWIPTQKDTPYPSVAINLFPKNETSGINHLKAECEKHKNIIIIAYSLGGRITLDYIQQHNPQNINALILESVNPGIENKKERQIRYQADKKLSTLIQTQKWETFINNWYDLPLFGNLKKTDHYPQLKQRRLKLNPSHQATILITHSAGIKQSNWQTLENLTIPTLYIYGENDIKYKQIAHTLQNKSIQIQSITKAAHNTHTENTKQFIETVHLFLQKHL